MRPILFQGDKKEVVRIEIVPPDEYGPRLHHATNQEELRREVSSYWQALDVGGLSGDRDWVIECPSAIAQKAVF